MVKNKSEWMKERWRRARTYKDWYINTSGGEDISVKEFLKNDNPITKSIREVKLTYKMKYEKSNSYEFYIPQDTIRIYVLGEVNNIEGLNDYVKDAIAKKFKGGAYLWVRNHLDIEMNELRGIEYEDLDYNKINIDKIDINKKINVVELPKSFKVIKKNKNNKKNVNSYDLTLDIFI